MFVRRVKLPLSDQTCLRDFDVPQKGYNLTNLILYVPQKGKVATNLIFDVPQNGDITLHVSIGATSSGRLQPDAVVHGDAAGVTLKFCKTNIGFLELNIEPYYTGIGKACFYQS